MSPRSDGHVRNTLYLPKFGTRPRRHVITKDAVCREARPVFCFVIVIGHPERCFRPRRLYLTLALRHPGLSSTLLSPLSISLTPPVRGYERRRLRRPSPLRPPAKNQRLVSLHIKRSLCFHLERRIEPAPPLSECVGVLLSSRNLGGAKYSALTATRCTIRAT